VVLGCLCKSKYSVWHVWMDGPVEVLDKGADCTILY
jgi:hypothetical protein